MKKEELKSNPQLLKLLTLGGILCVSIPISFQLLWIYAFNSGTTQADRVEIFENYFPEFLYGALSYFSLTLCIMAIIFSSICLVVMKRKQFKIVQLLNKVNSLILVLSCLLLLLNVWQLM